MRNLQISSIIESDTSLDSSLQDARDETIYFALREKIAAFNPHGGSVVKMLDLCNTDYEKGTIVLFEFLPDDQLLCVILSEGTLLTVDPQTEEVEVVAQLQLDCDEKLNGGQWSPDMQLLVLSSNETLYALSREFDIISQQNLRPSHPGRDELQTIGWGSRETQFQGAVGKANRERLDVDKIPLPLNEAHDEGNTLVSWRSDAQYFAVSSVDEITPEGDGVSNVSENGQPGVEDGTRPPCLRCRRVRVWNRDLELMSNCEFLAGMEAVLCMRPVGNLIATTQMIPGTERRVRFFERNGQYRHSFTIADGSTLVAPVKYLSWNGDATILAMSFFCDSGAEELQFWTVSNYNWAEKLRLRIAGSIASCAWDPENPRRLHLVSMQGRYQRIELDSQYHCDDMLALVVNGRKLRVTDLRLAPVPPPMCHVEIDLGLHPSTFSYSSELSQLVCYSQSSSRLRIFDLSSRTSPVLTKEYSIPLFPAHVFDLQWKSKDAVTALIPHKQCSVKLLEISLESGDVSALTVIDEPVTWHKFYAPGNYFDLLTVEGRHLQLLMGETNKGKLQPVRDTKAQCSAFCRHEQSGSLIVLTRNHQLLIDGACVHSRVLSFTATNSSLLFTTLDNLLHCAPLPPSRENVSARKGRSVENGARLVGHEENGTAVCLQLPRGNLETIHPRDLLIPRLKNMLDKREYGKAIAEMRRYRIKTDLLYDHSPKLFLEDVQLFVEQVNNPENLCLFLTSLAKEDTSSTMFAEYYPERNGVLDSGSGQCSTIHSKINPICESLRKAICDRGPAETTRLYTAVIASFVMENPHMVSEALKHMQQQLQELGDRQKELAAKLKSEWLRHFAYLVDASTLFNSALKTYDLHIALMVAECSDRDPKEYLPVLNELRSKEPEQYRHYHIELFLGDWSAALERMASLLSTGSVSEDHLGECRRLIAQHELHSKALLLFSKQSHDQEVYKEIRLLCAIEALAKKNYNEATTLFVQAGEVEKALTTALLAFDYKRYICIAERSGLSRDSISAEVQKIIPHLIAKGRSLDAAALLQFTGNGTPNQLIDLYCSALAWDKAAEVAEMNGESLDESLRTHLVARCSTLLKQIEEWHNKLAAYTNRLLALRAAKAKVVEEWQHRQPTLGGALEAETLRMLFSQCSSTATSDSKLSKASASTEARRRKQVERKKAKIKEGSQYEDAALMVALKEIYRAMDGTQDELVLLLPTLLSCECIVEGRQLQSKMFVIISYANHCSAKIWPKSWTVDALPGPLLEHYRREDGTLDLPLEGNLPSSVRIEEEMVAPFLRSIESQWHVKMFEP